MMRHTLALRPAVFLVSLVAAGCGGGGGGHGANAAGTLVFGAAIDEVAVAKLGSNTSTQNFHGLDPAWTSDGRIVYDLWGEYSPDMHEHLMVAAVDGTGAQSLVDMLGYNSSVYASPRLSPDGRFVAFNYRDEADSCLGTTYGTLVYTSAGAPVAAIEGMWDASWAPDGSLVVSGTVSPLDPSGMFTFVKPGLFHVDPAFMTLTPIGAGLTMPQYPSVSPDGQRVAFVMNNHLWVIGIDGTGLAQLTTGPNEETYSAWSPDGQSIAVVSLGDLGGTSGTALAVVSAAPAMPTTVSQSATVWVGDMNNSLGLLNPVGTVGWR